MKLLLLTLIWIWLSLNMAAAQNMERIPFSDSSCQETSRPLRAVKGQQIDIQCDTVYVINKHRFRLYEKARNFILQTNITGEQELLRSYEIQLQKAEEAYRTILGKYELLAANYAEDLKRSTAGLDAVRKELMLTQEDVKQASAELEDLRKKYQDRRSAGLPTKLLWAGGGAVAGIVLMLIVN